MTDTELSDMIQDIKTTRLYAEMRMLLGCKRFYNAENHISLHEPDRTRLAVTRALFQPYLSPENIPSERDLFRRVWKLMEAIV